MPQVFQINVTSLLRAIVIDADIDTVVIKEGELSHDVTLTVTNGKNEERPILVTANSPDAEGLLQLTLDPALNTLPARGSVDVKLTIATDAENPFTEDDGANGDGQATVNVRVGDPPMP